MTDRDGTVKHISEIDDVDLFNDAFYKEISRLGQEATGGSYSPVLYEELVRGTVTEAHNRATEVHIANRANQKQREQVRNTTAYIDSAIKPFIDENNIIGNKEGTTSGIINIYRGVIDEAAINGMSPSMASAVVANDILMRLNDTGVKGIAMLEGVAELMPEIWNNPEARQKIQSAAQTAVARRLERDRAEYASKMFQQKMEVEDTMLDLAATLGNGDILKIPSQELEALRIKYPLMAEEIAKGIAAQQGAVQVIYDAGTELSPAEFNKLCISADAGKLSPWTVMQIGHTMSMKQREHLISRTRSTREFIRSEENRARAGTSGGYSNYTGKPEKLKQEILERIFSRSDYKNSGKDNQVAVENEVEAILVEVMPTIQTIENKYGDDPVKALTETSKLLQYYMSDGKLADLIFKVNHAQEREDVPIYPEDRAKRYAAQIDNQLQKKGLIPQYQAEIGKIGLKIRNDPDYTFTDGDFLVFKKAFANYHRNDETKVRAEMDEYGHAIREIVKYSN